MTWTCFNGAFSHNSKVNITHTVAGLISLLKAESGRLMNECLSADCQHFKHSEVGSANAAKFSFDKG